MVGSEFRKWRRSLEISQEEVAEAIGCNKSSICRWEKGEFEFLPSMQKKINKFYEERNKDGE